MKNYEQIKTVLLIGLVCLSLVLTWQLWSFQSNVTLLDETAQYIPSEVMSEEKKLSDVIIPQQMIVVKDGERRIVLPNQVKFQSLYDTLLNVRISDWNASRLSEQTESENGVVFLFSTAIPLDLFFSLFQSEPPNESFSEREVSQLYLYVTTDENVHLQFIDENDASIVDVVTSLSKTDLEQTFFASFQDFEKAIKIEVESRRDIYIPAESVTVDRLAFSVSTISGQFFKQALFPDPASVRFYRQSDNEVAYTDGSRIMNIRSNGLFMEYNSPVFSSEQRERSSKHIVQRSYEFINSHGGWTDDYYLVNWEAKDFRDIAEYRLHINRYPVISFERFDQMILRVSRSGNQTEGYTRPLFYLDSQLHGAKEEVALPSGEEIVERIEALDYLDSSRIEHVTIGYEMMMPSQSFISAEPHWFILYDGRWQKISVEEEGGKEDGLE